MYSLVKPPSCLATLCQARLACGRQLQALARPGSCPAAPSSLAQCGCRPCQAVHRTQPVHSLPQPASHPSVQHTDSLFLGAAWPHRQPGSPLRGRVRVGARKNRLLLEIAERQAEEAAEQEDAGVPVVTSLEWQSPLSIIKYPDPRLRAVNARIGVFDERLKQLAAEMFEVMYNGDDGVGLAAPQVGVNVRLMVFNPEGKRDAEEFILVNPRIVSVNKGTEVMEEGCLSFPQLFAEVERPTVVKIKAQDVNGKKMSVTFKGWPARIFQHEYDHLQGTLFHDRMKPEALAVIKSGLLTLERTFAQQNPGVHIQTVG